MWAVVPLKHQDRAKSRLASVLDPGQRRALFFALAEHVIRTLQATEGIDQVAVVTSSPEVAGFVHGLGAQPLMQESDLGSASAFSFALLQLKPLRLDRLLMITGDLPLLTSSALGELIALAGDRSSAVMAPDQRGRCVNALLCTPPDAIVPAFGTDSVHRNLKAAEAASLRLQMVKHEALAWDLDTAEDLDYLLRRHNACGLLDDVIPAWPRVRLAS
jgi:2-phospho-L-lactate guanylyltransferase